MALFPNKSGSYEFKGKTHTNLVISEGAAPAEEMIVSRSNGANAFHWQFGPEGNQTVVLAKGKIAEIVGAEYDRESGLYKTAVRQATDASEKVAGVNFHNVYAYGRDAMIGTLSTPTLITRNYIEVPLFETTGAITEGTTPEATLTGAQILAEEMNFGAAVSETEAAGLSLNAGDYVVADRSGNFRKFNSANDSAQSIVGQVWAKETNLPPAGFLQYYFDVLPAEMQQMLKNISIAPSPGLPNGDGIGAYPYGAPYTNKGWLSDFQKMMFNYDPSGSFKGLPYLTDGYFMSKTNFDFAVAANGALSTHVEAVRPGENTTYVQASNNIVVAAGARNAAVFVKLSAKLDVARLNEVQVTLNGALVVAEDMHVDVTNNTIVVYLPENETANAVTHTGLLISIPAISNSLAGVPTSWDFRGSVGAVRILLQK
jgi:hypothetical protein